MEGLCEWKSKEFCENLKAYLETNFQWMEAMIAVKSKTCPVWHNVSTHSKPEVLDNILCCLSPIYINSKRPLNFYPQTSCPSCLNLYFLIPVIHNLAPPMIFFFFFHQMQDGRCELNSKSRLRSHGQP